MFADTWSAIIIKVPNDFKVAILHCGRDLLRFAPLRSAPLVDPSAPKECKTLLSKSYNVRPTLLYMRDRLKTSFPCPAYITKATLPSGFDAMFCFAVGVEGFERRSRRRATFENKHIIALQPRSQRISDAQFGRQRNGVKRILGEWCGKLVFTQHDAQKKRRIRIRRCRSIISGS